MAMSLKGSSYVLNILVCTPFHFRYSWAKRKSHTQWCQGLKSKSHWVMARGKNDKIDACQIARYAYLRREEIKEFELPSEDILKLKGLLSLRERLVKHRTSYLGHLKELKAFYKKGKNPLLFKTQEDMVKELSIQVKRIESEMLEIIKNDPELKKLSGHLR